MVDKINIVALKWWTKRNYEVIINNKVIKMWFTKNVDTI